MGRQRSGRTGTNPASFIEEAEGANALSSNPAPKAKSCREQQNKAAISIARKAGRQIVQVHIKGPASSALA